MRRFQRKSSGIGITNIRENTERETLKRLKNGISIITEEKLQNMIQKTERKQQMELIVTNRFKESQNAFIADTRREYGTYADFELELLSDIEIGRRRDEVVKSAEEYARKTYKDNLRPFYVEFVEGTYERVRDFVNEYGCDEARSILKGERQTEFLERDVIDVTRCCDCLGYKEENGESFCEPRKFKVGRMDYCSKAIRRKYD